MDSRIENTKRNLLWGAIDRVVLLLFPFITRTLLIHVLGMEYVGIGGLFTSVLQVLSLAELGFGSAIVYSMYKPIAEHNENLICSLLLFYKKIYKIIGTIILVIGICLLPFLHIIIKGEYPNNINIYIIYCIYLANTVVSYFLFAYKKSLLIAYQRKDIVDKVTIITRLILGITQIALLLLLKNYYIFIILMPIFTVLENILCSKQADKKYPNIRCIGELDSNNKNDIIEKTKGLLVYKLCGVTRNSFDNIFISFFFGLKTVGMYSNYYYIMSSVRTLVDIITTSMSASIGNSVAIADKEKNYKDLNLFTFLYAWICGWCTICLLCLYQPFMELWAGKENLFPLPVVVALCIYFYIWTAGDIRSQYTDACGLWWKEKKRSIVETIANIVLNYILVRIFGVFGIIIATAISILFIGIPWCTKILFDNYFTDYKPSKYLLSHIIYGCITIINGWVTYHICISTNYTGFMDLLIRVVICIFIPNIIYLLIYLPTNIFKNSLKFFARILKLNY